MKKRLKLKPLLIIVCAFALITLSICTVSTASHDENVIIKELIENRIKTLCDYYSSEISYDEAKKRLELIETSNLLNEDIKLLKEYINTDIEPVNFFNIKEIDFTCDNWNNYQGSYVVEWELEGYFGTEKSTVSYAFNAIKKHEQIKLTNIKNLP